MTGTSKRVVGNISSIFDVRTRFEGTDRETHVIDFRLGDTPRKKDKNGEWQDGEALFTDVTAWGRLAQNIAESFNVGDRVFVEGREEMKPAYTNSSGEERPAKPFVTAHFAGHEVSRHAAHSERVPKDKSQGNNGPSQSKKQTANSQAGSSSQASSETKSQNDGASTDDEPDFGNLLDDDLPF